MKQLQKFGWIILVGLLTFNTQAQLIPIKKGNKYGFQHNGTMVISPQFDYAGHFTEGLALVQSAGAWGYIDSAGNWQVQPVYSNATPLQNGFAYVFKNGKRGVIGRNGKVILEAIYDSIINQGAYHMIVKGKLRGIANEDFSLVTPVIYTEINHYYYHYFCCKRPNGTWDIYSDKELVIAEVDQPLDGNNFLTNTEIMFLKKGGRYGVWKVGEGWRHAPAYDSIFSTPYPYYTVGNNYFREVFLLWNEGIDPDPDSRKHQSFQVMDGGGTILSKERFYTFDNPLSEKDPVKFQSDEVALFLYPGLKAVHLPYRNIVKHLEWYIASDGSQNRILDSEFLEIGAFDKVEPVMVMEPVEYYDENDAFFQDVRYYPDQTPYLLVSKRAGNGFKTSLFSLTEKRTVTAFYDSVTFQSVYDNTTAQNGYIYKLNNGNEGIYLPGMQEGTVPKFIQIALIGDQKMICTNPENGFGQLWDLSKAQPTFLLEEYSIEPSSSVLAENTYFDSVSQEIVYMNPLPAFNRSFYLCRNEAEKIGLLCLNGERTPCIYDQISQNINVTYLLDVQIDGKYGIVNILNGETIAPFSDQPLTPDYNPYRRSWYATVYESNEMGEVSAGYYKDQYGKYLVQSLTDHSRFLKENGKVGVMAYSDFDEKEHIVIPASYKKLEFILQEYECDFLKAKGTNGKWGVLDFKGDTLIPFQYDVIKTNYFSGQEIAYILCEKGKKWALYNQKGACIIPFGTADYWEEVVEWDGTSGLITYKVEQRYGLVAYNGKVLTAAVLEDVNVTVPYNANPSERDRVVQYRQGGKWWAIHARIANNYDQIHPELSSNPLELTIDTAIINGPYDFIIGDWYFRENSPGDVTVDRVTTKRESVQQKGPMPQMAEGEVVLFSENGKIGIQVFEDEGQLKKVLAPTFTNVAFYDSNALFVHDKGQSFYYNYITKKRLNITSW